jgi:hypothetical protein
MDALPHTSGMARPLRWLLAIPLGLALFGLAVVTGVFRIDMVRADEPNSAQIHATTLAGQLVNAANVDFTAVYRSTDGTEIMLTNAHRPDRMSASAQDWTIIIDRQEITECHRRGTVLRCSQRDGGGQPMWQFGEESDRVAATAGKREIGFGLVLADDVSRLLWDVTRLPAASVSQRFDTLAGRAATCIIVASTAEPFEACVTEDGLLGRFIGTLRGHPVSTTMISYYHIAYASELRPPKDAVFDR